MKKRFDSSINVPTKSGRTGKLAILAGDLFG